MKNRHFGGGGSGILAGKARKCGKFWVFACDPNPGKQSIWRQCPPSARKQSTKRLPNRPGFTHVQLQNLVAGGKKVAILLWNSTENGRFVQSFRFVPGRGPVCPRGLETAEPRSRNRGPIAQDFPRVVTLCLCPAELSEHW